MQPGIPNPVDFERKGDDPARLLCRGEEGIALLIAIIALVMFSLLGLYMVLNSATEVRISDNYESRIQAKYAAQAGLNHARRLLKGLNLNDCLKGADGTYNNSSSYLTQARTYGFRNFVDWATARSLDILNPDSSVSTLPDDGLVNTGKIGATNGTILIPLTGIALTAPNPYGSGTITTARYFVKITDNNGEASELAKDAPDNPFFDGDGIVIIRSVGVSQTIRETAAGVVRANSVAVFEARFKQRSTFNLDSPFVVEGNAVQPSGPDMFSGNSFNIDGGANNYGVGTIDVNTSDAILPSQQISSQLAPNQTDNIEGMGLEPSIVDITGTVSADADKALLLDKNYLYNFATISVPSFADYIFTGNQNWAGGSAPDIGSYDITKPYNDPSQTPKVTFVNGDLSMSGNITGGGLLVVTGKLTVNGAVTYNGLVLNIGAGDVDAGGLNRGIYGGLYVVNVTNSGGTLTFGTPKVTLSGNSNITIDSAAMSMATRLIPATQLGWREITSSMDP